MLRKFIANILPEYELPSGFDVKHDRLMGCRVLRSRESRSGYRAMVFQNRRGPGLWYRDTAVRSPVRSNRCCSLPNWCNEECDRDGRNSMIILSMDDDLCIVVLALVKTILWESLERGACLLSLPQFVPRISLAEESLREVSSLSTSVSCLRSFLGFAL